MGSIVQFVCPTCRYATGELQVGWGKAGRAKYWGGLAVCAACKEIRLVDLSDPKVDRRDRRCAECNGPLKMIEGMAERVPCPFCATPLEAGHKGSWS
jgi:hypothetical protein